MHGAPACAVRYDSLHWLQFVGTRDIKSTNFRLSWPKPSRSGRCFNPLFILPSSEVHVRVALLRINSLYWKKKKKKSYVKAVRSKTWSKLIVFASLSFGVVTGSRVLRNVIDYRMVYTFLTAFVRTEFDIHVAYVYGIPGTHTFESLHAKAVSYIRKYPRQKNQW